MLLFLRGRIPAFKYAFAGVAYLISTQKNAWIHLVATIAVIVAGALFKVTGVEWVILVFAIGFVWVAEAFNTAIEALTDLVCPHYHSLAKIAKDTGAAAVLFAAITAAVVGVIVFIPYIFP